jgi:hypothetical protein
VSANVEQIAAITQGTAAGAQESARAVHELSTLAMDLQAMVGKFKVQSTADDSFEDHSFEDHSAHYEPQQYEEAQFAEPAPEPWHGADGPFLPGEAEGQFVEGSYSKGDDAFSASASVR